MIREEWFFLGRSFLFFGLWDLRDFGKEGRFSIEPFVFGTLLFEKGFGDTIIAGMAFWFVLLSPIFFSPLPLSLIGGTPHLCTILGQCGKMLRSNIIRKIRGNHCRAISSCS